MNTTGFLFFLYEYYLASFKCFPTSISTVTNCVCVANGVGILMYDDHNQNMPRNISTPTILSTIQKSHKEFCGSNESKMQGLTLFLLKISLVATFGRLQ